VIAAWVAGVVLAISLGALLLSPYYLPQAQHAGAGPGALTVWQLIERVESETSGGRHRLRQVTIRGDLADGDELATEQTRLLPLAETGLPTSPAQFARHPGALRRVLAGLEQI